MIEVRTLSGQVVARYAEPCEHPDLERVESVVDGTLLAHLCPDCDAQLLPEHGESPRPGA